MRTIGRWKTEKPPEPDYYLAMIEGSQIPKILYWNGISWQYYDSPHYSMYRIVWDYLPSTNCLWGTK